VNVKAYEDTVTEESRNNLFHFWFVQCKVKLLEKLTASFSGTDVIFLPIFSFWSGQNPIWGNTAGKQQK